MKLDTQTTKTMLADLRGPDLAKLSKESGVGRSTLYLWRDHNRQPTLINFISIADVLGYEVNLTKKK